IIHDPTFVILDEPISGLDPVQIVEMRRLIRELKDRHTVLVSSHILPEISQTCDRLLVLRNGQLAPVGSEAELSAQLGTGRRVRLEISGEKATIDATFEKLKDANLLATFDREERDGFQQVRASLLEDRPEELARAVVEAGLGLRRLEP